MTTYKDPQSIRIASRKLSPDTLHEKRSALTLLFAVRVVKLAKPLVGLLYLQIVLILTVLEVSSSASMPSYKKTRRCEKFSSRIIVWAKLLNLALY